MSSLTEIIEAVRPLEVTGSPTGEVSGIACHPADVTRSGFMFVCMNEYLQYNLWQTWRSHLEKLPSLRLSGVIVPERIEGIGIPQLVVADPRKALGLAARCLYQTPDAGLRLYGVTGTNGKTTTTRLVSHILSALDKPCGSIGTLGVALPGVVDLPGTYTTPLAPQLYATLDDFRKRGAAAVSMEVSSHALALERVAGLAFDGAILTNVERDHLDFHGTLEAYAEAKRRLFAKVRPGGFCILNKASPHCGEFAAASTGRVLTYGLGNSRADYEAHDLELGAGGSRFSVRTADTSHRFECQLAGAFQIENALAAIALVHASGFPMEAIGAAVAGFPPVSGRMEQIALPGGATAIVDYAHNPDGLRHLLQACRPICRGRLHVVFGCGGDRDKGKRPLMGAIAGELADTCWITSDNPRTEDPVRIIGDILQGMSGQDAEIEVVPDRTEAIAKAYARTLPDDLLVVAGKGHEDYQIVGLEKRHFSDHAVLRGLAEG